jgi:hypothetical protein
MASLNMTSFASGLKQLYTPEKVQNMVYQDNPLYALLPKNEKFNGKNMVIPVIYGNPQGASGDFATAKANKTASRIKDFTITRNKEYALASVDNETMMASEGNSGAFMEAFTLEMDGAIHTVARALAIAVYGSGTGKIGQIAAGGISSLVITLSQVEDITNFEVDQKLNFSTADGGGSVKATEPTNTNIDRDAGTITVSDATGLAALDYIFRDGDYDNKLKGLQAWLPTTVTSTPFFGMDRSVDKTRLGGIQITGSNKPIEEALIEAASRIAREGGKPTHVFMSYAKYADLEKSLGSKVQYVDLKVSAEIGFRGILLNGPRGMMKVIPDQNCPSNKAFMLQLDTWKLYSLGKAPQILNLDSLQSLREDQADAVELRVGAYAQLACNAPGWNGVINF